MFAKIIILVFLTKEEVFTNYLDAEANYPKPKLERNNIVNKGVWVRNKFQENLFEKGRVGDFIFRENSLDVDNILQNNFDAFGTNYMQDSPLVSAYVKRTKRATRYVREQRPRKSVIKSCSGKNCRPKNLNLETKSTTASYPTKSKQNSDLRTTSVFNDYPYEVAIVHNNNKTALNNHKNDSNLENVDPNNNFNYNKTIENNPDVIVFSPDTDFKNDNSTVARNTSSPKRSMKYDFETEIIKKFEFTEDLNKTDDNNEFNDSKVNDRNIFDKDNTVWHQNAPIPDVNVYKVVPKEPQKSKPVTERGLIKVISMLTKTFKKIMKQHNDIKDIHSRINDINDEFIKNAATMTSKFQDFDLKYLYLLKFHEKLKVFDAKLTSKQEYFKNKELEMARNFKEFENQQKKFLQQQRQFYNIQKLMLAQNEKINLKQNLIAKTQSEISHRQNNFARILKKAKQLYVESKNPSTITKLSSSLPKANYNPKNEPKVTHTPSSSTPTSESVKINLFSIPTSNKIENQDDLIIKEKDEQTIDDLVYKYYFNNTFIDNLMKNNVLTSFIGNTENAGISRTAKSKRNELETTVLLPLYESNDSEAFVSKNRERRWINHHSRHKNKRRDRGKDVTIINATDAKLPALHLNNIPVVGTVQIKDTAQEVKISHDPFLTMATNFCIEIHQNLNEQMLRWCVEKALRRLRFLDVKSLPPITRIPVPTTTPPPTSVHEHTHLNNKKRSKNPRRYKVHHKTVPTTTQTETQPTTPPPVSTVNVSETTVPTTVSETSPTTTTARTNTPTPSTTHSPPTGHVFFPGNDELESNLKQFDINQDIEGNVYYEGSVHASEILDSESDEIDDIMPGLESNSQVDMDPLAFEVQARRRAYVRKLNEEIIQSLG